MNNKSEFSNTLIRIVARNGNSCSSHSTTTTPHISAIFSVTLQYAISAQTPSPRSVHPKSSNAPLPHRAPCIQIVPCSTPGFHCKQCSLIPLLSLHTVPSKSGQEWLSSLCSRCTRFPARVNKSSSHSRTGARATPLFIIFKYGEIINYHEWWKSIDKNK